ncbi:MULTISPECIES: hypothetical protein [unclassified Ochrobactrum]|jgi:hypothetical protein|uniref:hypothetical protein n=1 Tax=unclassified Ochrobactrum TaxID=239106 RepID=UPI000DEEC016|nr:MULTISPECIES: hypothetical protein [unclassified Ochrobactrum]MBQ0708940.1 hypothetical protein [Ochrobactrum sp. AP1BH01-1]
MSIIDDLKALQPPIYRHALDEFQKAMDAGLTSEAEIQRETGFMDRVASRAAYYFYEFVSRDPADFKSGAAHGFSYAWCMAERETLRRAVAAISKPDAKGHEVEILQALLEDGRADDAVKQAAQPVTATSNVVTFPRKRVTDK